jgi:agmatine/peptidylarginine deiminase
MNKTTYFLLPIFLIGGIFNSTLAQDISSQKRSTLTHHMSAEEKALFHLVGKDFKATDPPPGVVRNIAEFDQMEGVLISFANNFGISYELIAAMSEVTMVTTVVETVSIQNSITNQYTSHGVNMDNVNFLVTDIDSYWSRDYGPWYVAYGDDQIGIVDFIYNRPNRPNDNAIPSEMADFLGIELFAMDLITAGGNYMTTGEGISASSDLVWEENPTLSASDIDQMVSSYLGVDTYHVLDDPNNTYIDHIDCWGKFLGVNKVLIREVPQNHPQYDEIEETAAYFENQVSSWGYPFEVYRVWTPNNEPYTNSLILNDHVFVPIVNGTWDDEAIAVYQQAMPGYEILGFTGSWESTDALHCRTKGTADRNTLYINHIPLLGVQDIQPAYGIEAEISAYSGQTINNDNVKVHFWINGIMQDAITMTHEGGKFYTAILPAGQEGSEMTYYISAVDEGGNMANHPFIGEPDPHVFYVGEQLFPALVLGASQINALAEEGSSVSEEFEIQNTGQIDLSYEFDYSTALFEDHQYEIEDGPSQFSWDSNTYTELGWTGFAVSNAEGDVGGWAIEYTWNTDQYYYESTFKAESPSGTVATIAAGLNDGTYTAELDAFNGEQMQGTWKIWIEDSYGDGGHQATNIMVTITRSYEISPWLTLSPLSGFVSPNGSETIEVVCDATGLPVGSYEGKIFLTTNDPQAMEIEFPVYFQVDVASELNEITQQNSLFSNFPNPFKEYTVFEINTNENNAVTLFIYNANGQLIRTIQNSAQGKTEIIWDGANKNGATVNPGIYFYQMKAGAINQTGKLIKT